MIEKLVNIRYTQKKFWIWNIKHISSSETHYMSNISTGKKKKTLQNELKTVIMHSLGETVESTS